MKKIVLAMSAAALLAACSASLPPPELVDARAAYAKATGSLIAAPEAVLAARSALDRAETGFREHGDTPTVRTLAYVAMRKAQTAEVRARVTAQKRAVQNADVEIARIDRDRLREGRRLPHDTGEALVFTAGALERSNVERSRAEESASASLDRLRKVVRVRDQGDSFVVKLSGPVVFGARGDRIEDAARAKLDAVARVILSAEPDATIRVESHADSGVYSDLVDRAIAQKRARAIADYLASRGVPRDRITPVGYAPRHVLREAANYDFYGLDRRLEIVVTKPIALAPVATRK